ncbi:MAG: hypothetical protein GC204_15915 [Chloroflexi bacterium]|nr:hypothetical protein [Chloroflexota bacterium]
MPADIVFQPEVARGLLCGVEQLIQAIRPTIGPLPGIVAVTAADSALKPELLDDAALIARRVIQLGDVDSDVGAMLLRQMLWQLHEDVGDGAATAALLFHALLAGGIRYTTAGGDPVQLRAHLEAGLKLVWTTLDDLTRPLDDCGRAAHTLCDDPAIADVLGEIFTKVGAYAPVEILDGYSRDVEREYVPGTLWTLSGVLAASTGEAARRSTLDMDHPLLLATDFDLEAPADLEAPLRFAVQTGAHSLILIVRSVSEKVQGFIASAGKSNRFQLLCVKTPGQDTTTQMQALQDISLLAGGRPLLRAAGETFASLRAADLGRARRAWATSSTFGIEDGAGDPDAIERYTESLQSQIEAETDYGKRQALYTRLSRFFGLTALVRIGGASTIERKARHAQASRALRTLRAASIEGVVPGGGVALLVCRDALIRAAAISRDEAQQAAYRLLAQALQAPFRAIVRNSGLEPGVALSGLIRDGRVEGRCGYDVRQRQVVDVWQTGLLDSAPVVRAAVRSAVKTAALCLTLDVIVHHPQPDPTFTP